jgi:ribosomal protein S18 acetylase RimI-like enzyme
MQRIISRNHIDLEASQVMVNNQDMIGVGMLAMRGNQGWIGGLGVRKQYRRQGYARQLMETMLQVGQAHGLAQIQLEVIRGNTGAYLLYKSLGFRVLRQLFLVEGKPVNPALQPGIEIRWVAPHQALAYYHLFHKVPNPWQRQLPALRSLGDEMSALLALKEGQVQAYAVGWFHRDTIRWMDAACAAGEQQALQAIIAHVHQQNKQAAGSLINIGDNDPAWEALQAFDYRSALTQFEMMLTDMPVS